MIILQLGLTKSVMSRGRGRALSGETYLFLDVLCDVLSIVSGVPVVDQKYGNVPSRWRTWSLLLALWKRQYSTSFIGKT